MPGNLCIHCYVSGRVQGVWYRASAQEEAKKLGLTGWAKNLPDGRVEVVACGSEETLMKFVAWLKKGPAKAEVSDVSYEVVPWQEFSRFGVM
jgi:acylphosphatase